MSDSPKSQKHRDSQSHEWSEPHSETAPIDEDGRNITALEDWFHEAWLMGNVSRAHEVFADDVAVESEAGTGVGRDAVVAAAVELNSALAEMTGHFRVVGAGSRYVASYRVVGRHEGCLFDLPPTGKFIEISGVATLWFAHGLARRVWQTCSLNSAPTEQHADRALGGWVSDWGLTPREASVARLVMTGLSDKEVATRLDLALTSIHKYVQRILRKANASSRTELPLLARVVELG